MSRISPHHSNAGSLNLRISRPVAACSRCRRAKIKCDGKLPACTACEKAGHANSCASHVNKSADGKEKSYVASLESKIRELERKIAFATAKKSSPALKDSCNLIKHSNQKDDLSSNICMVLDGKAARRREVADVNELVSDFGFLSINATTHDFEKATTNMTFARLILAAASNEPLPDYGSLKLPAKPVTVELANHYVNNILCLIPIFNEKILFDVLEAIYQDNLQPVTDSGYWLFYMVLAISSINLSRDNTDKYYKHAVILTRRALSFADRVLVPGYVSQIQALLLLVQYSMLDPAHFDSWTLIGFACRAILDLGFHQDPPKEEQTDQKTLKLRRNLFYCVYSLDRSISMVHARSFSFTDDSSSVALPNVQPEKLLVNDKLDLEKNSLKQSLLLFKIRKLQSMWYQELFQSDKNHFTDSSTYIWKMCHEMKEWAQSIPEDLPSSIKDLFDLELFYSYVYCLAPSSRVKAVSSWGKNLMFEAGIKYAQKLIAICQAPPHFTFFTYHDALRVYFVGSQLVSVFLEDQDYLFNSSTPPYLDLREFIFSLQSPCDAGTSNSERALCFINQIKEILKTFSHRWQDSKTLLSSFETQIDHLPKSLNPTKDTTRLGSEI